MADAEDENHLRARECWDRLLDEHESLVTSNYVLLETLALLQRRLGLDAARAFQGTVVPGLRVLWVDAQVHDSATATWLAIGRRQVSLVDCTSFTLMRQHGVDAAFAFDAHFAEQGLTLVP